MNKFFVLGIFLLISLTTFSQDSTRPIHSVSIYKTVNNEGKRINVFIEIDFLGNVYTGSKKTKISFDKENLTSEINKYVTKENIKKYPGNNDISFTEPPTAELNRQHIEISIIFLDDVAKEQNLRNKTYYSWGQAYDKDNNFYPLFQYLSKNEVDNLKSLLK